MEGLDFESISGLQMPKGHEKQDLKDIDKCPFANKMNTEKEAKNKTPENKDDDSEDEQPKGGCPVMTSEKNKNPNLAPMASNFE